MQGASRGETIGQAAPVPGLGTPAGTSGFILGWWDKPEIPVVLLTFAIRPVPPAGVPRSVVAHGGVGFRKEVVAAEHVAAQLGKAGLNAAEAILDA